jgi:hypothetical protein
MRNGAAGFFTARWSASDVLLQRLPPTGETTANGSYHYRLTEVRSQERLGSNERDESKQQAALVILSQLNSNNSYGSDHDREIKNKGRDKLWTCEVIFTPNSGISMLY